MRFAATTKPGTYQKHACLGRHHGLLAADVAEGPVGDRRGVPLAVEAGHRVCFVPEEHESVSKRGELGGIEYRLLHDRLNANEWE
jgi:hypothetical protein